MAFAAMRDIDRDLSTEADIPGLLPQQLVELRRGIEETLERPTTRLRAEVYTLAFAAMREIERDLSAEAQIPGLLPQQIVELRRGIDEALERPTTRLRAEVYALAFDAMREIDRDLSAEAQIPGLLPQQIVELRRGIDEALERPTTRLRAEVYTLAFAAMRDIERDLSAEAQIPGLLPQQIVELRRGIDEALERPTTRLRAEVFALAFDAMREIDRDLSAEAQIPGLLPQQIVELRRGIDEALERPTTRLRAEVYALAFDAMREVDRDLSAEAQIPGLLPQQIVELRRGIEEALERPTTRLRAEVYALAFDAMREVDRDLSAEAQIPGLLPQQIVELRRGIEEALERPTTRLRAEVYTLAFDAMREIDRDLSGEAQIPGLLPQQIVELRRGIEEALERPTTTLLAEVYANAYRGYARGRPGAGRRRPHGWAATPAADPCYPRAHPRAAGLRRSGYRRPRARRGAEPRPADTG